MPLHIPTLGERVTEADIWAYAARILTDPASYKADVSALALEATLLTVAGYLDTEIGDIITALGNLPTLAHFDLAEFEKCQAPATENNLVVVNVTTADQSLGSKDITVDIPAGSTIISAIAVARISIVNDSATAQKIGLQLDVETVALFEQDSVIGFGAVDGASGSFIIAEDATGEVTADAQVVTLEAKATLSAAASVRFQVQYYLFITYKMG